MQAERKKIVFHIGLERTGTTSFQTLCYDNKNKLLRGGVLYPTRSLAYSRASRNHAALAACYLSGRPWVDYNLSSSWRPRERVLSSLLAEISGERSARAVLISAEHFSSRFDSSRIEKLAGDFGDFDCEVVVVLRAHRTRALSAYSSTIRAGRRVTPDQFFDELLLPQNWYVRYRETIEPWERAFGRTRIRTLLYEEDGDIVDLLVGNGLTAGVKLDPAQQYFVNFRHDACVLEALRRVNERTSPEDDFAVQKFPLFKTTSFARSRILMSLSRMAHERISIRDCVSADRLARLDAIAADDAAWLKENHGLEIAPSNGSTASRDDACALARELAEDLLTRLPWEARLWLSLAEKVKSRFY